jgi:tetratricopeptide (TPR) repeat protein
MPYDLFISYSRRDNEQGRITQLVERIKTDFAPFAKRELVPFFDQQEIHGMQDWRQRILQGLRESRLLLACLSPAYLKSEYCEWEFVEYLKYEIGHLHRFNGIAPIYLVEVPGWESKEFEQQCAAWIAELRKRQHFDLRPWHDQGEEALRETAVQERMGKLNRQIVQTITRGERAEKSLGNVDAHNPHFIGRTANLRMLRDNFIKPGHIGVVTAVNGVGGLGKTALAIEYAHAFADEYGGGRWQVRCAGKDDLRLALAELATPIGFEFTDDEKKNADLQFERTRRELKKLADACEPHRCLLLLDNVDRPGLLDPAPVARLNGGDWLHVLATTRLGENELHGAHRDRSFLAIDELPSDDALALIESYQPDGRFCSDAERDAAREIVRLLGCFTLAVESAAVYLGQFANDVTCAAFLARLKREGLEGLDVAATQSSEGVLHEEKRLGATLRPTLERLSTSEKLALTFSSFLPADQVALPWLRALVAKKFPEMERDAEPGYPDPWKNLLRRLFSLRLLQATGVIDADSLPLVARANRLVQQLVLLHIQPQARGVLQQAVTAFVVNRVAAFEKITHWEDARWELEPLTALAWLWDETKHPQTASLLNQVGLHWQNLAEWSRVEPLMRRALVLNEMTLGPEHPDVATSLNNLAGLLKTTNRLSEVEALYRRALAINELSFGPEHPSVAKNLNNLAQLLKTTNRLTEAEPLMRRALAIDEKIFGPEHPDVATCLNNLADLLQDTNRLGEAAAMYRRALAITEKSFGPEDPAVAKVLNNLAQLLQDTNCLTEAELMNRRSLEINERSFGQNHPAVAVSLACFAHLMQATNRLGEAEPLMRRALAIWEGSLGPDHPDVAVELNNLARVLQRTNRLGEAEALMRRALAIDEKSFGPEHPNVAIRLNNLAHLLKDTNRLGEAEPLMRRQLEIFLKFTRTTGHQHPFLQDAIKNYQHLLRAMGRTLEETLAQLRAMAPEFFPK